MTMMATDPKKSSVPGRAAGAVSDDVIDQVMAGVDAGGLELLGPDGVLAELTKRILERGLSEEMTMHLGYEPGDTAGWGTGNNRNGTSAKTVLTEIGPIDLDIPRDATAASSRSSSRRVPAGWRGSIRTSSTSTRGVCRLVIFVVSLVACMALRYPRR